MYRKLPLILICCFLVALLSRLVTIPNVFKDGDIFFFGHDPYYHMRRVVYTVNNFPQSLVKDSYMDYPRGYNCFWPPLFDQIIAFIAIVIGLGSPGNNTIGIVGAFFPAVLGALTIFIVYFFAKEIFDKKIAILSAFMFAIIPAHIGFSILGRPDHHVAEPVFSNLMYIFFLIASRKKEIKSILIYSILAGVAGACSLLVWIGSSIFIGFLGIFIILQFIIRVKQKYSPISLLTISLSAYLPLLIIITPICLTTIWGSQRIIAYDALSLFHPLFISAFIFLFVLSTLSAKFVIKKEIRWYWHPISIVLMLIFGIAFVLLVFPQFYENLKIGLQYFSKKDPWFESIGELHPLLKPRINFPISFERAEAYFTKGFYVFFIALFIFIWDFIKHKKYSFEKQLFLLLTFITMMMTLNQQRFSHLFAVNFVIMLSYLLFKTIDSHRIGSLKNIVIGFLLFLLFVLPSTKFLIGTSKNPIGPPQDFYESLQWLKRNTPETSGYLNPDKLPEYGVLAPWSFGIWIQCIAHRPVVASNFHNMKGNIEIARFVLSEDENKANEILNLNKVRYIITTNMLPTGKITYYIKRLEKDESLYYQRIVIPGKLKLGYAPTAKYYNLISEKLYLFDGTMVRMENSGQDSYIKPVHHYRLIYESKNDEEAVVVPIPVKKVKIFEYVSGAKIEGETRPKAEVTISLDVKTNQNRVFNYTNTIFADNNGYFTFVVPYSTKEIPYETKPMGPYVLTFDNKSVKIDVTEKQIITGEEIILK